MKIQVTQKHIDEGKPKCPNNCPVALALIDAGLLNVGVTPVWIRVEDKKYHAPTGVYVFVQNFDEGQKLEPFEFELDLDYPW